MDVIWILDEGEATFTCTEDSLTAILDAFSGAADDSLVQLNDPRFCNGEMFCYKKSLVKGFKCSETAYLKYLKGKR